jgi:hypothetical protein
MSTDSAPFAPPHFVRKEGLFEYTQKRLSAAAREAALARILAQNLPLDEDLRRFMQL